MDPTSSTNYFIFKTPPPEYTNDTSRDSSTTTSPAITSSPYTPNTSPLKNPSSLPLIQSESPPIKPLNFTAFAITTFALPILKPQLSTSETLNKWLNYLNNIEKDKMDKISQFDISQAIQDIQYCIYLPETPNNKKLIKSVLWKLRLLINNLTTEIKLMPTQDLLEKTDNLLSRL